MSSKTVPSSGGKTSWGVDRIKWRALRRWPEFKHVRINTRFLISKCWFWVPLIDIDNKIFFNCKREENSAIFNHMDELGGYYAKWNKPVTERQIPHELTDMCNLKNVEPIQVDNRIGSCQGLRGGHVGTYQSQGTGLQVWRGHTFQRFKMHHGD